MPISQPKQTSIALSSEDLERIDALIEPMMVAARQVGSSVTRSAVVRAAILRGISELEKQYLGAAKDPPMPWEGKDQ